MKLKLFIGSVLLGTCAFLSTPTRGADASAENVGILEEKVNRLTAMVEDIQFRQKKFEEDLTKVKDDLREVRGGDSTADIKALQDRVAAIDAAREKDKKIIIDELARQLASICSGKPVTGGGSKSVTGNDYVVQKGDTLSSIAKGAGCTVADLRKLNNLTGNTINVGQKLAIPQK
jgi:LysM repeat protein